MGSRTFLLGAGFSKAFHPGMPLMRELGADVCGSMGRPLSDLDPFGGDVERWLSHLAEDEPWLDEAQTLSNHGEFLRVSEAVAASVSRRMGDGVQDAELRELLDRFVLEARVARSPILTFNYDLLIEEVLVRWRTGERGSDLYPMPMTERYPVGVSRWLSAAPARRPALSLLKLHGSLNWMYPRDGDAGAVTWIPTETESPKRDEQTQQRWRHLYDDLRPLIVPPASTKSRFYGGAAMRALWREAAAVLHETEDLVVIGYSFPKTDLQVSTMVATTLPAGARIHVVDIDESGTLAERIREACPMQTVLDESSPRGALDWVEQVCGPIARYGESYGESSRHLAIQAAGQRVTADAPRESSELTPSSQSVGWFVQRYWPSAMATERPLDDESWYSASQAYIPKNEWLACPNPLEGLADQ